MNVNENERRTIALNAYLRIVYHGDTIRSCAKKLDIPKTTLHNILKEYITDCESIKNLKEAYQRNVDLGRSKGGKIGGTRSKGIRKRRKK